MKKLLSLLLSAGLMLSMAACGGSGSAPSSQPAPSGAPASSDAPAEQVEISFWHAMSGVNEEAIQKITDDFMAQNPNVKVTLMNQGGYRDLFDKLMASAKANQLPNLAQIYSNRLSWYVDKGLSLDLTPYMDAEGTGLTEEDYADIPTMFMDDCIWGEGQYAMPFNKSMMVLYYNVGMFEEAGIEVPTTWEEWAAAAEKLTKDTDGDGEPDVYGVVCCQRPLHRYRPLAQAGRRRHHERGDRRALFRHPRDQGGRGVPQLHVPEQDRPLRR